MKTLAIFLAAFLTPCFSQQSEPNRLLATKNGMVEIGAPQSVPGGATSQYLAGDSAIYFLKADQTESSTFQVCVWKVGSTISTVVYRPEILGIEPQLLAIDAAGRCLIGIPCQSGNMVSINRIIAVSPEKKQVLFDGASYGWRTTSGFLLQDTNLLVVSNFEKGEGYLIDLARPTIPPVPMPSPQEGRWDVSLHDGHLLACSMVRRGEDQRSWYPDSWYRYIPESNQWESLKTAPGLGNRGFKGGIQSTEDILAGIKDHKVGGIGFVQLEAIPTGLPNQAVSPLYAISDESHASKFSIAFVSGSIDTLPNIEISPGNKLLAYQFAGQLYSVQLKQRAPETLEEKLACGKELTDEEIKDYLETMATAVKNALAMYGNDWDDQYPSSDDLEQSLEPYLRGKGFNPFTGEWMVSYSSDVAGLTRSQIKDPKTIVATIGPLRGYKATLDVSGHITITPVR